MDILDVPKYSMPLINGLRIPQLATGSHLKLISLLNHFKIGYSRFFSGGDGSGGWTSSLLRYNPGSQGYFNSLFTGDGLHFRGGDPVAPAAVACMPKSIQNRCLNLHSCWEEPSDLSLRSTWSYLSNKMKDLDLITLDMEVNSEEMSNDIEDLVSVYAPEMLKHSGCLIYKTYVHRLNRTNGILDQLSQVFNQAHVAQTGLSGSHTSEIYLVFRHLKQKGAFGHVVDRLDLFKWLRSAFCWKTPEEELRRARKINPFDTLQGIPKELVPYLRAEWTGMLTHMGVSGMMTAKLAGKLSIGSFSHPLELAISSVCVICEDLNIGYNRKRRSCSF